MGIVCEPMILESSIPDFSVFKHVLFVLNSNCQFFVSPHFRKHIIMVFLAACVRTEKERITFRSILMKCAKHLPTRGNILKYIGVYINNGAIS